jgi:hypothetical protein
MFFFNFLKLIFFVGLRKNKLKYFGSLDRKREMAESSSPKSPESSEGSIGTYTIRKSYKEEFYEGGKLVKEVIQYGEVSHRTILDIFGHLMYFDDLKQIAKFPDETTYLVAKYEWDEKECYFTVFKNTNRTDEYSNDVFFFERKFERNSMGMEPFITLSQIECELEAEESETSSSALSSQPVSPKAETVSPKEEPPKKASVSRSASSASATSASSSASTGSTSSLEELQNEFMDFKKATQDAKELVHFLDVMTQKKGIEMWLKRKEVVVVSELSETSTPKTADTSEPPTPRDEGDSH